MPEAAEPAHVALSGAGKAFGRRPALRDVTLDVPRGSFLLVLGPNAAGKSTLLRILAGLARPTSGTLLVDGTARDAAARIRPQVGYVAHQTLLYDSLSARQNLSFYARLYGVPTAEATVAELLRTFALEAHADRPVAALSRGLQQRAALARALVHGPRLLVLDEPYSSLDAGAARLLTSILAARKAAGATLVVAAHAPELALDLADAVAILADGELRHRASAARMAAADVADLYERATRTSAAR